MYFLFFLSCNKDGITLVSANDDIKNLEKQLTTLSPTSQLFYYKNNDDTDDFEICHVSQNKCGYFGEIEESNDPRTYTLEKNVYSQFYSKANSCDPCHPNCVTYALIITGSIDNIPDVFDEVWNNHRD